MKYQVKADYLGKVRLEDGTTSAVLDENTSQETLAKFFATEVGKTYIEPVVAKVEEKAPAQPKS